MRALKSVSSRARAHNHHAVGLLEMKGKVSWEGPNCMSTFTEKVIMASSIYTSKFLSSLTFVHKFVPHSQENIYPREVCIFLWRLTIIFPKWKARTLPNKLSFHKITAAGFHQRKRWLITRGKAAKSTYQIFLAAYWCFFACRLVQN